MSNLIINKPYKAIVSFIILLIFISCSDHDNKLFVLKTNTDIDFNNKLSPVPDLNILTYLYYYNGSGLATGDFNNDGLLDLYFTGNQVQDKHVPIAKVFELASCYFENTEKKNSIKWNYPF